MGSRRRRCSAGSRIRWRGRQSCGCAAIFDSAVYLDALVELANEHELATLILHQRGDHIVPIDSSERAAKNSSAIELVAFDDPEHTRAWNDDPKRYEEELTSFLGRELGLGAGMFVSATTQAVLDAPVRQQHGRRADRGLHRHGVDARLPLTRRPAAVRYVKAKLSPSSPSMPRNHSITLVW